MSRTSHYLLLDRILIQGANTLSSPITYGFPAISGFLGAIHALNRHVADAGFSIDLSGILVACHDIHVQNYRPHPYADFTFNQSRNPIKKNEKTASIIEEGKAHLTVSLVVEISSDRQTARYLSDNQDEFLRVCTNRIMQQRFAGGSVFGVRAVRLFDRYAEDIKQSLLPAFVLMDARQDLIEITCELQKSDPCATELDALLEVATLHHEPVDTSIDPSGWITRSCKTGRGWLAPIPVGFQALAPAFAPGELANSRNPEYPGQYVEAIYSLGKWLFPTRLPELSQCFWRYRKNDDLFLITQDNDL